MAMNALDFYNLTQKYIHSDEHLKQDEETKRKELESFNNHFNNLFDQESTDMDDEEFEAYKAQFKPYEANKQFTPQGRSSEFAKRIQEVKSTDNWKNLSDEDKTKANKIIGQKYRELRLAEGLPIEPVEYDANKDANQRVADYYNENAKAAVEYLGELAGQHWNLDENQPKEIKDLTLGNATKAALKSVARIPGSVASSALGFLGGLTGLAGSAVGSETLKDLGSVMGTGANSIDAVNQGILPTEQKAIEGIKDILPGIGDRTFGQKVLTGIDQLPEQLGTWYMPGIMAKTAKGAVEGGKAYRLAKNLQNLEKVSKEVKKSAELASKLPKLGKLSIGAKKSADLAQFLGLHNLDPEKAAKFVGTLGSMGLELSEMFKNATAKEGEVKDPLHMGFMAAGAGLLEDWVPSKLFRMDKLKPATRAMLRRDFGKGFWKSSKAFIGNLGKDTIRNIASEGGTELLQTYLEQAAANRNAGGSWFLPYDDAVKIKKLLDEKGFEGVIEEAKHNERLADIIGATLLGGISGGLGNIGSNAGNYISYNTSPEGYLDRYRENREALINDIDNAKTDEERNQKQQQLDQLDADLKRWELSNPDNARQGRLNSITRSFEEMANAETSDEDLKDSLRGLSEYNDDLLLDYADLLQKAGWESNETFDKNLDKLIKYKEDINFKSLPKSEQNRILKEREKAERQAKIAEEAKKQAEFKKQYGALERALLERAGYMNLEKQYKLKQLLGKVTDEGQKAELNRRLEELKKEEAEIYRRMDYAENEAVSQPDTHTEQQQPIYYNADGSPVYDTANVNAQQKTSENTSKEEIEKNISKHLATKKKLEGFLKKAKNPEKVKKLKRSLEGVNKKLNELYSSLNNTQQAQSSNDSIKTRQAEEKLAKKEQENESLRNTIAGLQQQGNLKDVKGKPLPNGKNGFVGNRARLKAGDIDTECEYAIVELADLQTLSDEENPRQRNDRQAYQNTVSERARNLDPDLLIDNSVGAQNGPIVIDQNLKVESGNGRTLSLREAYRNRKGEGEYSGTENDAGYGKADLYRNKLIAEAPKYGISSEQVMQMKEPVLVRIRVADSNINAKDFWAKANNSQQESMSSTETALVDGEKVKPFLNQFEAIGDIRAKSNLEFVKSFLEKICSPYELNSMFTSDGRSLSEAGEKRINNAIIASAYGASAYGNSEIVSLLTELGNEEIQTILNGLAMAAPDTAKLMGEVKSGAVHNVDFSKDLADAIRTIKNIRQNPDMNRLIKQFGSVSEVYLRQGLLGDDGLSPTARLFIGALGKLNNKETICNFLKSVNNTVRAEGNPNQLGMFEANTKPSDEVFVERAIRNMGLEYRNGKPIADDIERLKQGPVHVASNDDFHAEDAQGRRYSLDSEDNPTFIKTESGKEEYGFIDINSAKEISKNAGRNIESAPIKVTTRLEPHLKDDRFKRLTELGYKSPKELVEDIAKNFRYVYEGKDGSLILVKDTSDNSLAYIQLKKSEKGNYYEVESIIPTVRSDYFNKKKKLLDKAQSNHIGKTNTPSAISGGSFSNLSISENDDLSSRRNSLSDSEDYRTEAERLADDGTTATREEFDNVIQNVNESLDPDAGISFEIYDSVEDFNKGRTDKNKAPSDANAFIDKDTGKIVFFRDKLTTLTRLKQVIAHELVGHEGIERLLGGRYYNVFLKSIRKLASRDGRVGKLFAQVQRTYGRFYSPESHQMYEELGAHLAELYARKPERFSDRVHYYIRKLKVMFRNALRNWGVDIEFNQVDLEDILDKARESVETNSANESSTNDSGRRYSRRRKADDKNQLKFWDYDREDNEDYSEKETNKEPLGNEFADLYDRLEKESSEFDDYDEDFVDDEESEYPDEYYGKDGWKLIQSYQENRNVIYDILPRILEEDYESVSDPFSDYYNSEIPAPVQALLKITNNGELLGDLDYYLNNAEGNLPGSEAIDLLEHLKNHIKETYYKPFANKIIRNCDKAIDMIRNGEFKEGVIKPVSIEELERQDIKKMPKTEWELEREYYKANKEPDPTNYSDQSFISPFYSLSSKEIESIKQKAIDDGTFLKAPNGNHSNLNQEQWLEARTKTFKDKFGDWELVSNADKISKIPVKNVKINNTSDKGTLETQAQQFGEITNTDKNIKAIIPVSSAGKIIKHKGFNIASIFGSLKNLFETSVLAFSEPEKIKQGHKQHNNIEQYHHYINKFTDGKGNTYYIRFTLHQEKSKKGYGKGKNFIHSTFISDVNVYEAKNNKTNDAVMTPILTDTGRTASPVDFKLQNFFNSAKEFDRSKLDENGEPKAEYLKSAPTSSIVQKEKLSSNQSEDIDINNIPAPRHYSLASDKELKRVSDHIGKYFNKNNMTSDEVETAILESVKNYGMNWIKIENYLKGKGLESGDFDDELANMVIEADEAIMKNKKLNSKVYQSLKEYYEKNKLEKIANYIAQYNIDPERPGFIKLARDKVLDAINDGLNKYVYGGKYDYTNFLKYIKKRYDLRIPYKQLDKIAEAVYYNPIKKEDSGSLEDWLERNYDYDKNEDNGRRYSLTNPDESIEDFRNRISDKYGITKFNDYIHVQKKLLKYLPETFYGNVIVDSTGDTIRISRKTIKETFDKTNYADLPTLIKLCKLEVLNNIPALLKDSARNVSDAENYHGENKTTNFDYYETPVEINGKPCKVQFDVKKSVEGNKLHLYRIEIKNEPSLNLPHHDNDMGIQSSGSFDNRVSQNEEKSRINEISSVKRFSLSSPVERTKDLIAIHNLSEDKLKQALDLGGLPMPSIAITKDSMGHDHYGDYSIVFGSDTIDPKKSRYNKVYSGDAYTPMFPNSKIGYKIDTDKLEALNEKVRDIVGEELYKKYAHYQITEEQLNSGLKYVSDIAYLNKTNPLLQAAYLKDKGIDIDTNRYLTDQIDDYGGDFKEYRQWLNNLFDGIVLKKGLRNNKDIFTSSGNRRKFESLYDEITLNSIVKAMRAKDRGVNDWGIGNIFGSSTYEYSNLDRIRKDSDRRMKRVDKDEYEKIRKGILDRFSSIANPLPNNSGLMAYDDARNVLCEAVAKYESRGDIERYIREQFKGWAELKPDTVDELIALRDEIRAMPTGYFEAKPERAVDFDEIAYVVAPDNANPKIIQKLQDKGVDVFQYKEGDSDDRLRVLNDSADRHNIRFSLAGTMPEDDFDYNVDDSIIEGVEYNDNELDDGVIYSSEDNGRRYSLCEFIDSGERFVDVKADQSEFDGLSKKEKIKKAVKIIQDKFAGKVVGIDNRVFVNNKQAREYGYPSKPLDSDDLLNAKMRASAELDNLVDAGTNFRNEPDGKDGHIHYDTKDFSYFDVLFKVGKDFYKGLINIKNNNRGRLFYDITKIENVTEAMTDSNGNIPAFGFLRDTSMPSEKSPDNSSITENSENGNIHYSLSSDIDDKLNEMSDYVDKKLGRNLDKKDIDSLKAILGTDKDSDIELNDIPTLKQRGVEFKDWLAKSINQLIQGFVGDTQSKADRKKAPYLWQKDHNTEPRVETPYEISRRHNIEEGMKIREEEDRLVLKHLDADKNFFTSLIRKITKPGPYRDWMLKKASRILAPFQMMKPVENLLFTVAENIMWDEAKQQMVIAPYRDVELDGNNKPIGYKYDPNEKNGKLALDIYNNSLNDDFKAIIKERSIANNKFREDFVNRVVPYEQAKLYLAKFARKRLEGASKRIIDGNDQQAYSYITKLKGVIDDIDYKNLISQYDQIRNVPENQLGRNSAHINSIIGELTGNPGISSNGIDGKLRWLTTNKGLYGYAHHLVSIDPENGSGKPFNALSNLSHPWIETIAGDRRGRKTDSNENRSLLKADLERNRKEAEAEAANRWMEDTENQYGITVEEAKILEAKAQKGEGPGMPEGYEHRHKVVANFGKFRGKIIYLPDETFEAYQMVRDNRSLDSMKQFCEFMQGLNNINGRINEAMLYHPGKAMRDLMAGPFHLLEFLRDWSMKHPTEIADACRAMLHGIKNSVSPEYWQSHTPESMGEYSESVFYQGADKQSPTVKLLDSVFKYFQKAIPVGQTLEAIRKEINLSGGADIPLKRIFTTIGEELADKRGLQGQERDRFIYDMVNDYAFDTSDLPEIIAWFRGKKTDKTSKALGMISRATVPFMGYATRMIKQMVTDPVTKGAIPLAKRGLDKITSKRLFGDLNANSSLRSEISEVSRPFFWLLLKALISAGLGGLLPEPTAEEIQDMPGLPPSARTHTRFHIGDSDKGERYMSVKGLGQLETAMMMDDYLKGKSNIVDLSSEFLTLHPIAKYVANLTGLYSEYDKKVPFTTQTGKLLANLIAPELTTRFTDDLAKIISAYSERGITDRSKQTFLQAFLEKLFGWPQGEVIFDREGHLRLSSKALETLKLLGVNVKEIPFDTIEETTRAEASRISNDAKKIQKLRDYRAGKYAPKTEREFLKQDFGGDFSSVEEAEKAYSNLAERERRLVDTATKLHKKGHWTDLEDIAREKKEAAAEKRRLQNEGKPTKRRRPSRKRKVERPLLNDDLGYINNEIRKNISGQDEYQDLYDKLMQNNKKHNPRRGVAGQLERLLKELK